MTSNTEHSEQIISLYGGSTPVRSRWSYRANEPFTVVAAFQTDSDRWVEWIFGRDLLAEGLTRPAGEGDVRLSPEISDGRPVLALEIESPDGHAVLEMDLAAVQGFLAATTEIVPMGAESDHFDIDGLIDEITNV
ncbi:SsgA family sporulation/cell division regulator [Actinokineospora auranticolor]|uniref:Sporulation and cell division protein SsgA n=1 Tax=Actinokineospora auranticolor TaxID=155976 RepID=A0A2S6GWX6_9PSEU|nr:SsgA family sporulation/cell division regulator [Actinokineospora auranticolor]PPK69670.1 sporulation and cell division protein SsgA [Actinokineospora auranticolor]